MEAIFRSKHPRMQAALLSLVAATLVGGCATQAQVRAAPGANVADYKTFSFVSPLGTDRAGYSSFLSSSLKSATRSALEAKGYTYSESGAKMGVNFSGQAQQKTEVTPGSNPLPIFPHPA